MVRLSSCAVWWLVVLVLGGCAGPVVAPGPAAGPVTDTAKATSAQALTTVEPSASPEASAAQVPGPGLQPPAVALDIGIVVFDPGLPEDPTAQRQLGVFPLIRKAEGRYLPALLRQTLIDSGHWGVVRVMPQAYQSSDLLIEGVIRHSDGEVLTLAIEARDGAGRMWLDKTYQHTATEQDYQRSGVDPFQALFDVIARDLLAAAAGLTPAQHRQITQLARLRYGAELSPETFEAYLQRDEAGIYQLRRLPAQDDPMFGRIERIRRYEHLFIDTADEQYLGLFGEMQKTYNLWRRYSRELLLYIRADDSRDPSQRRGLRRGSFAWLNATYGDYEWFRRQEQLMEELSGGFNNEVVPTVLELEDSVVNLSGDLETQYGQWRSILRSLFELERGAPPP
ncbi:hypothetical protein FKG94_02835 [Exilibacterium tricleocarpae]|uniref:DUF3080 domain-containing protein n=1 Tax=Exilibacterium tricleocarpae TaxID=2591008 RepID=A0A545U6N5_9GAMM|nr:hypothetical protein [Exilibacterium tricleocarpae]TQV85140.1 hypothetical protein FKG94_02835 [Exilibacterium tricleocarpae]